MNEQLEVVIRLIIAAGGVSMVMPLLVSVVIQSQWSKEVKEIIVLLSCLAASVAGLISNNLDLTNLVIVLPTMVWLTRFFYLKYWKPSGIAPWIERITDVKKPEVITDPEYREVAA